MAFRNMDHFTQTLRAFHAERDWGQFHNPKNLVMKYFSEVSELVDFFLLNTPEKMSELVKHHTRHYFMARSEIADCFRSIVTLAEVIGLSDQFGPPLSLYQQSAWRSPHAEMYDLNNYARQLHERFVWLTPEASVALYGDPKEASKLHASITLNFNAVVKVAQVMEVDILLAVYAKHQEIAEKYTLEKSKGNADKQ